MREGGVDHIVGAALKTFGLAVDMREKSDARNARFFEHRIAVLGIV